MTRKDSKGYALHTGECQRKDGKYVYAFTDRYGKRHFVYAKSLMALRERERKIKRDYEDGLDPYKAKEITVNDMVESYLSQKHDLKVTTKGAYYYAYNTYIKEGIGKARVVNVKYSDIKRYYYSLILERGIKAVTVDHVHTILHPAFQMALRDGLIRVNPTDGVMCEIKRTKFWVKTRREALSVAEQKAFMDYLNNSIEFKGWCPVITILLGTGMRIGECLGLTWDDLDFENRMIHVTHAFTDRPDEEGNTKKRIQSTKTGAGTRDIPMIEEVFDAFLEEYEFQKVTGFCEEEIDGYTGFVFTNSIRTVLLPEAVNNAIHRIVKRYNREEEKSAAEESREPLIVPEFSAHVLRHTFCTRLCENMDNIGVIQSLMGHADVTTTMNIYNSVKNEKKQEAMKDIQGKIIF